MARRVDPHLTRLSIKCPSSRRYTQTWNLLFAIGGVIRESEEIWMADEVDMAQELEQLALKHALAYRKVGVVLKPKGACYNCDEVLNGKSPEGRSQPGQIFCDKTCAEDWERRQSARSARIA